MGFVVALNEEGDDVDDEIEGDGESDMIKVEEAWVNEEIET